MAKRSDLFIRLSLDYADHPKIASLSDAAFRAHIEMILYSRKYETDGVIKNRVANRFGSRWDADVLSELQNNDDVAPSLTQLENGDYELHGYADMQETKAEIAARRRQNAENGRKGGRPRKREKSESVSEAVTQPRTQAGTRKKAETETETETDISTSSSDVASDAPDGDETFPDHIIELCDHLAECIRRNGNKVGAVGKRWHQAMDRLNRIDGYTPEQIRQIIDWSQQDEFWQGNILSAPKLREKFDQLKTRMLNERNKPPAGPRPSAADRALQRGYERHQQLEGAQLPAAPSWDDVIPLQIEDRP